MEWQKVVQSLDSDLASKFKYKGISKVDYDVQIARLVLFHLTTKV